MASFNRVILMGNVTRDPELRYISSGTAVTDLGVAVNERVKRGDQWTDEVNYFDVTLWARTAEIANEYLSKGSPVLIEGRLKYETWETPEGQKRSKVKIIGEKMQMLGKKGETHGSPSAPSQSQQDDYSAPVGGGAPAGSPAGPPADDDIPF